ncbi:PDC sensor domain-containing protein [Mycolicibacterium palauense]|uniref:PDC sensor domain-containing protein n=1 Tax=Mycolicibacterium palauense TaxID=2034511 RepID=UPI000BFF04B4|nr:cache domain-containing protein [Mycolicibacterium palauense]
MSGDEPADRAVAARDLAERASGTLEPVYRQLEQVSAEVLGSWSQRAGLTEARLSGLHRLLVELLQSGDAAWGIGFVAAPFVVDGKERYLAWWQRRAERVARLRLNFDPTSIDVYDYLQMDWYRLAQRGQARVAYGPYVDYSGSDMYTITATVPVVADGEFLGVAGADLVVGEVERGLLEVLSQTSDDAVIVSSERRVIAANTPRWLVGSKLAAMPAVADPGAVDAVSGDALPGEAFRAVADLPLGTGWTLALAAPDDAPR